MGRRTATSVHRVLVIGSPPRRGRPKLWAFGLDAIADLCGITVAAVRKAIQRGQLDPGDLRSLMVFAGKPHQTRGTKRATA